MRAVERSNQELDDFAYIASHDLKEPLRGLANNAMFLQEDYADKIDEGGVKRLQRMIYLCHRMERLVDDLLYFSRHRPPGTGGSARRSECDRRRHQDNDGGVTRSTRTSRSRWPSRCRPSSAMCRA